MTNSNLPKLRMGELQIEYPIIQGGMGIGVSSYNLAGNVSKFGGLGVLSSVALDRLVSNRHHKHFSQQAAVEMEVRDAREIAGNKPLGINIMVAIQKHYKDSIIGALDGGIDVIVSGAGLPMPLPEVVAEHPRANEVKLIPIVSSGRALELICKRWLRSKRLPDAVVVEGPLAGGHIGWKQIEEAYKPENRLENLIEDVLKVAKEYGDMPVIAAGGIYSHDDILKFINMGCAGVQLGTRFLATKESGATQNFKDAVVNCIEDDIVLADQPGSPCRMLFRVLKHSPFYQDALIGKRLEHCDKGYLVIKGECLACQDRQMAFCICNGLLASARINETEKELWTVGANAYKVKQIMSVQDLMSELTQVKELAPV